MMKASYTFIVVLIVLTSCNKNAHDSTSSDAIENSSEGQDSLRIVEISDSMDRWQELKPFLVDMNAFRKQDTLSPNSCDWYCLKTLNYKDTNVKCEVRIDLPNTNSWRINAAIKKELFGQRDQFLSELEELNKFNNPFIENGMLSDFQALLISANQDDEYVSFCFAVSYYSAGAVHGMPMFYSFNFERRTHQRVNFNDFFHLETPKDSLLILDLIRLYHGSKGLHLKEVYEFDFNLYKDYVTLNFDAYEIAGYAYGTLRVPLNREMIEKHLRKK